MIDATKNQPGLRELKTYTVDGACDVLGFSVEFVCSPVRAIVARAKRWKGKDEQPVFTLAWDEVAGVSIRREAKEVTTSTPLFVEPQYPRDIVYAAH